MSLMQRQEITIWETKCKISRSHVTVLDVLPANTLHQSEADRCKTSIHAEESLMKRGLCRVCRLLISERHDTAVGVGVNGCWHPDHWADVLHYAGKTKGQGQEFRGMSEWPWCLEHSTIIIIIIINILHSSPWGQLTLRQKVIGSTLQMFHYSTFLFNCKNSRGFCCWLPDTHRSTHLRVPGLGLSPEQLERAGVFGLDPPGRHHQIPVRLRHHYQVGPLNDASLDALDKKHADVANAAQLTTSNIFRCLEGQI